MPEHQQIQQSQKPDTTFQKQATPVSQTPVSNPYSIIQRAKINPKSLTHADIMQLQRTIGNQAVGRLLSSIGNSSTAQQATVQRQEIPEEEKACPSCMQRQEIPEEEEPLQGKMNETVQRQEIPEEEEPLQGKMAETVQLQEIPEEEEPLQGKFEDKPEIACPSCFVAPIMQKQEIPEEEEPLQGKMIGTIQRQEIPEEEEPLQGKMIGTIQRQEIPEEEEPLQTKRENNTGMPDNLKAGVENLSGIDMSDVRVHYNSDKPAEVGALAYTQGADIHVAPGQERHLPHEAWHVVQQAQGRVRPTMQMKNGVSVNDDEGLEHEADEIGRREMQMTGEIYDTRPTSIVRSGAVGLQVAQRLWEGDEHSDTRRWDQLLQGLRWYWNNKTKRLYYKVEDERALSKQDADRLKAREGDEYTYEQWIQAGWPGQPKSQSPVKDMIPTLSTSPQSSTASKIAGPLGLTGPTDQVKKERSQRYFSYVDYLAHTHDQWKDKTLAESLGKIENPKIFTDDDFSAMATACMTCEEKEKKAAMVKGCIEQLYSGIPWEGRVAITVYTEERQGKGDLILAMKTVQLLREALPHAKGDDIALVIDQISMDRKSKPSELARGYGIDPITPPYYTEAMDAQKNFTCQNAGGGFTDTKHKGPQTFIRAPVLSTPQALERLKKYTDFAPPKESQDIGFTEYAKRDFGATPTGLKPEELGIMVHHDLHKYKQELAAVSKQGDDKAREFRHSHIVDVTDQRLVKAILSGPSKKAEDLQTAINEGKPTQEDLAKFTKSGAKLYFGYTNRSGTKFVKTVAELEKGNQQDIDIVHVGYEYMSKQLAAFENELRGKDYQETLKVLGIDRVEVVKFKLEDEEAEMPEIISINPEAQKPRTLRLIFPPRLKPVDMIRMIKASEATTMMTGNQSTSEAISAGKNVIYECLAFEQNQEFMKDIYNMGQHVEGGEKMHEFYEVSKELSRDILTQEREQVNPSAYARVADMLRGGKMDKGFQNLSDLACTTKDFRARLIGMYKRGMLLRFQEATDVLVPLEDRIKGNPSATSFREFANGLQKFLMEVKRMR